jgi:type II secretory pathway component PulF
MNSENETRSTDAFVPAILLAAFHGMLWIVLLGMMLKFVPTFVQIFEDFDAELPGMTKWTIRSSYFSADYWFAILPVIVVLCAADLMVLHFLYLRPKAVVLRWLWLAFMLLVPLSLMVWTVLAIYLPFVSLTQQLR